MFHATGSGGRAMEALIADGFITGVADVTTTEWCDELVGGILSAGPDRLDAAGKAGIPQVVSLGALDMVNFGAARDGAGAVPRPEPLPAQPDGHPDAHDARGERRAGPDHRGQAQRRDGPRRAVPARCGASA